MKHIQLCAAAFVAIVLSAATAQAACEGSNGRGWASGKGAGKYEMTSADKTCLIDFNGFIDEATNTRTEATQVELTKAPKNGKIAIAANKGIVYTPTPGFKGKDQFCTKSTHPEFKGKSLRGCTTVTVN